MSLGRAMRRYVLYHQVDATRHRILTWRWIVKYQNKVIWDSDVWYRNTDALTWFPIGWNQ